MRIAARSLVAAAFTVLVLAGCEGMHSHAEHAHGAHAHGAVAEARAALDAAAESPEPTAAEPAPVETDPRFDTCSEAAAAGFGPYAQGVDPEYDWYRDSDHDGTSCEK